VYLKIESVWRSLKEREKVETRKLIWLALGIKGFSIVMVGVLVLAHHYVFSQPILEPLADVDDISFELQTGTVDLNAYDEANGLTGLMLAVTLGDLSRVKLLLEPGRNTDPNLRAKATPDNIIGVTAGNTALHYALLNWDVINDAQEIINVLLAAGADPNIANDQGQTAVCWVLWISDLDSRTRILKSFVDHGANVNVRDITGGTVLHYAIEVQEATWLENLYQDKDLASRFDFSVPNNDGLTAFELAIKLGKGDLLERIRSACKDDEALVAELTRILDAGLDMEFPPVSKEEQTKDVIEIFS
jgi:ankyrin repeat protein